MTTEQIRKNITVMGFSLSKIGIYITYVNKPAYLPNESKTIDLNPLQSIISLERIGSIDKFEANPIKIFWQTPNCSS